MDESPCLLNAKALRKIVLDMAYKGSTAHIGCAFSIIEILSVLYKYHLRYPNNNPLALNRDYLVLSKGHGVMAQYACMYFKGWLEESALSNYFLNGTELKGLSDSRVTGLEVTSGSLGHGFSVGVGLALGASRRGTDQKIYTIVGDGELNEGPIWEGALFASQHQLNNFLVIVDENGFQAMGKTADIANLGSIKSKFESFGFTVAEVDGHDEAGLNEIICKLWLDNKNSPKALITKTIKGKGVSFMENNNDWHYKRLTPEMYALALEEIMVTPK